MCRALFPDASFFLSIAGLDYRAQSIQAALNSFNTSDQ